MADRDNQILTAFCHSQGCRNSPQFCTHVTMFLQDTSDNLAEGFESYNAVLT